MTLKDRISHVLERVDETPADVLLADILEIVQDHVEEIAAWVDGDGPYHREMMEEWLPGINNARYAANRELKWSEPFTNAEIAKAIREKFVK